MALREDTLMRLLRGTRTTTTPPPSERIRLLANREQPDIITPQSMARKYGAASPLGQKLGRGVSGPIQAERLMRERQRMLAAERAGGMGEFEAWRAQNPMGGPAEYLKQRAEGREFEQRRALQEAGFGQQRAMDEERDKRQAATQEALMARQAAVLDASETRQYERLDAAERLAEAGRMAGEDEQFRRIKATEALQKQKDEAAAVRETVQSGRAFRRMRLKMEADRKYREDLGKDRLLVLREKRGEVLATRAAEMRAKAEDAHLKATQRAMSDKTRGNIEEDEFTQVLAEIDANLQRVLANADEIERVAVARGWDSGGPETRPWVPGQYSPPRERY
jgi:hypothetical protein